MSEIDDIINRLHVVSRDASSEEIRSLTELVLELARQIRDSQEGGRLFDSNSRYLIPRHY